MLCVFLHAAQPAAAASESHHADAPSVGVVAPGLPIIGGGEIVMAQVIDYVRAVEAADIVNLVRADEAAQLEAARVEAEREAAARTPAPIPASTGYSAPASSGGHSDAWWHGVAICEQGGRNDPYFGYFSFMDGSMGGQPWDVQVAAGNAVLARSASESPAWAPSCVAAGYAASPGG